MDDEQAEEIMCSLIDAVEGLSAVVVNLTELLRAIAEKENAK
jgi:hypothetical protein